MKNGGSGPTRALRDIKQSRINRPQVPTHYLAHSSRLPVGVYIKCTPLVVCYLVRAPATPSVEGANTSQWYK